ncbi:MAG: succinylglutamate desuccinylase/aspartoacylase family protein [Fimbriimonadaceae bacterium]
MLRPAILLLGFCLALLGNGQPVPAGYIGEGTDWKTPYYWVESGQPGPTVMIVGGVHGNEPAGAEAAKQILEWEIDSGRLLVLPEANVQALAADIRFIPDEPEESRDLNRNFPKSGDPLNATLEPISESIWRLAYQVRPDYLLDLHEGFDFHISNPNSVGTSIIFKPTPEASPIAEKMLAAVNILVTDPDRKFVLIESNIVNGSLARAAREHLGAPSMILETTFRDQPLEQRVEQHHTMVAVFLEEIGVVVPKLTNLAEAS